MKQVKFLAFTWYITKKTRVYCIAGLTMIPWALQLSMNLLPLVLETLSLTSSWHTPNSPALYCLSNLVLFFPNKVIMCSSSRQTHCCHNTHEYHTSPHLHIWPLTRVRALPLPVCLWTQELVTIFYPAPTEDMLTSNAKTVARYYCSLGYRVRKEPVYTNTFTLVTLACIYYVKGSFMMMIVCVCTALQAYPWTGDMYSHSVQVPHAVLKPQFSSHGLESHYPPLVPPQSYITPQAPSCQSLAKPTTPDPLLASVKTELEETGHCQPVKVSEAETIFHCDFSPIHFWQVCVYVCVSVSYCVL